MGKLYIIWTTKPHADMQNIITGKEKETIATKTFNCLSIVKI